jgi:hypothetical protein
VPDNPAAISTAGGSAFATWLIDRVPGGEDRSAGRSTLAGTDAAGADMPDVSSAIGPRRGRPAASHAYPRADLLLAHPVAHTAGEHVAPAPYPSDRDRGIELDR